MRRLYFLLPDVATARTVVDELLLARIEERHIHVIAKEGVALEDAPKGVVTGLLLDEESGSIDPSVRSR